MYMGTDYLGFFMKNHMGGKQVREGLEEKKRVGGLKKAKQVGVVLKKLKNRG